MEEEKGERVGGKEAREGGLGCEGGRMKRERRI